MEEHADAKWNQPGWRIEQKYDTDVLIGNWNEERRVVSQKFRCDHFRYIPLICNMLNFVCTMKTNKLCIISLGNSSCKVLQLSIHLMLNCLDLMKRVSISANAPSKCHANSFEFHMLLQAFKKFRSLTNIVFSAGTKTNNIFGKKPVSTLHQLLSYYYK